jgi:hypothetical protein
MSYISNEWPMHYSPIITKNIYILNRKKKLNNLANFIFKKQKESNQYYKIVCFHLVVIYFMPFSPLCNQPKSDPPPTPPPPHFRPFNAHIRCNRPLAPIQF